MKVGDLIRARRMSDGVWTTGLVMEPEVDVHTKRPGWWIMWLDEIDRWVWYADEEREAFEVEVISECD